MIIDWTAAKVLKADFMADCPAALGKDSRLSLLRYPREPYSESHPGLGCVHAGNSLGYDQVP